MKKNLLLLFGIMTIQFCNCQEVIREEYLINAISWKNPLMSFKKNESLKAKYKEVDNKNDTIVVHEISQKIQADMHFRAKCFQVANDLKPDDPKVLEVKKKMNILLKKWNFYRDLDYKIDKQYKEELIEKLASVEELVKSYEEYKKGSGEELNISVEEYKEILSNELNKTKKEYKKELSEEINALSREIDSVFPCPGGFNLIRGHIKFENGYLSFEPLKYRIFSAENIKVQRMKSYLNAKDKKYAKRKIGINLKANELVRLKNKSWAFGALTIPFKVYAGSKERDSTRGNNVFTDTNISLFASRQWGYHGYNSKGEIKRKKFHSLNLLLGASRITLNSDNSSRTESSDFNIVTLTPGIAYGFNLNKFGIFLGTGMDVPLSREGRKWYFDKQLWFGVGLGYSIFK